MSLADLAVREVDFAQPDETAWQAAVRMRQRAVGSLVVVNAAREPIGILTDRDLMERVLAERADPSVVLVRDVMTRDPVTVTADTSLVRALATMREGCFRRLPIVDASGSLVGLVSLDDILIRLAEELGHIGQLVRGETPRGFAESPSRWE